MPQTSLDKFSSTDNPGAHLVGPNHNTVVFDNEVSNGSISIYIYLSSSLPLRTFCMLRLQAKSVATTTRSVVLHRLFPRPMARATRSNIVFSLRALLLYVLLLPQASAQTMGTVTTLAGGNGGTASGSANGVGTNATFNGPVGVALSVNGSFALVVSSDVLCYDADEGWGS